MKFKGKKFISLVLAALMVVSVMVCGTVSAGAANGWGGTPSNLYVFYHHNSNSPITTLGKLRLVAVSSDTIYVSKVISSGVSGTELRYTNVGSFVTNWSNINYVFFGQFSDKTSDAFSKSYGDNTKDYLDVSAFLAANIESNKYTASCTDGESLINHNRLIFTPGASSLTLDNRGGTAQGSNSVMNHTQSVSAVNGSATITSYYSMTGTGSATQYSNVSLASAEAVYTSQVTVSATPSAGYSFDGWYDNNTKVSDTTSWTYTVTGARTLEARFVSGAVTQTANAGVQGTAGEHGSAYVTDGTNSNAILSVPTGTNVKFTAIPTPNYKFDGWYSNDQYTGAVITSNPYSVTANTANTYYAKFSAISAEAEPTPTDPAPSGRNLEKRNVNSTALSTQAKKYYQEKLEENIETGVTTSQTNIYSIFSDLANNQTQHNVGSWQAAHNNDLYDTLHNVMLNTKTHDVTYPSNGNNSLAHYWLTTDSSYIDSNYNTPVYTLFYSDVSCFNHDQMQREHIWPKSKASFHDKTGLGGSDLHHLRPAYGPLNNKKSNWGFADIHDSNGRFTSGWYNRKTVQWPAGTTALWKADDASGQTFCDYKTDVHGDIARILLYVYVTWHEYNLYTDYTITDSEGNKKADMDYIRSLDDKDKKNTGERVIYDLPTLLKWMREDPVSKWEMKRNDLTQNVQGNRNVFIDYPELAWLLFDETVPNTMETPSGMAKGTGTDYAKVNPVTINNPVTLDFGTGASGDSNGEAVITAFDYTTQEYVKNGEQVERGDVIVYKVEPDQSTIKSVKEFSADNSGRKLYDSIESDDTYTFTRQAGYYNGAPNTGYNKEKVAVNLYTHVCEVDFTVKSQNAQGTADGGSGSGMVTAKIKGTNNVLESGDTVPEGTEVTFTFTPDYGSRFVRVSNATDTPTLISGTDTYQTTVKLNAYTYNEEDPTKIKSLKTRTKKFIAQFAQTFTSQNGSEDKPKHIYNNGLRPDVDDEWGAETDFTTNFEICGAQIKEYQGDSSNRALRFVAAIDSRILAKAKSYGWVIGYTNQAFDNTLINRYAYSLVANGANCRTFECTDTDNSSYGDYGMHDTDTRYKYITATVKNIQNATVFGANPLDTKIIARPYVVLDDERGFVAEMREGYQGFAASNTIYGQYVDLSTGESFCACSGSYNQIAALASE